MNLEYYKAEKLKKEIRAIVSKYIAPGSCKVSGVITKPIKFEVLLEKIKTR